MKTNLIRIITAGFLAAISFSAFAVNYGFMSNSAMSNFTQEDWQIFNSTQQSVLNNTKDGVKVTWSNPKSGSYGYMVPSGTTQQNGMRCRYVTFYNTANYVNGEGTYQFCKKNKKWMLY